MSKKADELAAEIRDHFEGIRVQWQEIARETDLARKASLKSGVFETMDMVGELMRQLDELLRNA